MRDDTFTLWQCPTCKGTDLKVVVQVEAELFQDFDETGNFQTDAEGDHNWDSDSPMRCLTCQHSAPAGDFQVDGLTAEELMAYGEPEPEKG